MTQRDKILELLERNGTASNYELNGIAFRYAARLQELRDDGYKIRSKHIKGSRWEFTLVKEPEQLSLIL